MKKIMFSIPNLMHGGAEKVLVNLLNNMDPDKYEITLIVLFDIGIYKEKLNRNIRYISCFKRQIRGNSQILKIFSPEFLYKRFINEKYDVIISYLEGPTVRILSGCPYNSTKKIAWIHTSFDDKAKVRTGFRSYKEAVKIYGAYDKIISVSDSVKDAFVNSTGIDRKKVYTLYNTNDSDDIIKKSQEPIGDVTFSSDSINICSVGKIIEVKGYERLARVHKRLIDEGYINSVYIIGKGNEQAKIEHFLKANRLEDSFKFIGFRENPYKYVAACDLYICSSYREGFSTAVSEALILGKPVISTLCSGAYELLGHNNEYGLVVENSEEGLYKGLKEYISNPQMLEEYKKRALKRGRSFSKENTVKAVESMLDNL